MSDNVFDVIDKKFRLGELEVEIFRMCNNDKPFLIKMMKNLKAEYFESQLHAKIFEVYVKAFEGFQRSPTRKILETFLEQQNEQPKKFSLVLDSIFSNPVPINSTEKDYLVKEVETFAKRSRMTNAVVKSFEFLQKDDFEAILSEMKEALQFNLDTEMGTDLMEIDERYKRLQESLLNKMTTGYNQIDAVLEGGWARKEIYCFAGPPGIGKSIFLPNMGFKALLNGYNVVHYSLEMSEDRVGIRYDAIASSIVMKKLTDHPDEVKEKYETIKKITKAHLKIKEFPTSSASVFDIEAHLEQLKLYKDFLPDVIIVDYGDIMKSTRNTKSTYEEQGWIFRELRALAIKRNCVVITATQATRDSLAADGGTTDVIGMDKIADSMEKSRVIDVLFAITQSRQEKDDQIINLWIAKNRNGKSSTSLEFKINYPMMQIKEIGALNKPAPVEIDDVIQEEAK